MCVRRISVFLLAVCGMLSAASFLAVAQASPETELDRYVNAPDATYTWKVVKTVKNKGLTTFIVDLKSQTWRTTKDVDRTVWQHWLIITKPDKVVSNKGFVFISGGSNGGNPPNGPSELTAPMAKATNSVVSEIKMIPNEPLVFHGDGVNRKEDDLIGYCWDQFLKTGDATWAPRLPMVKSVVRAMDTITALLASDEGGKVAVDQFVVAGGSKRGWTTWLTGAVDKRVVAIVPIVIDVANVNASMKHHFAAYGFWAPAVGNYVQHHIFERMDDPRLKELYDLVDPYSYRDRLTMPKYIVNASGDQFFLPDSSQFYFDDLQGEKHLRYVPNADHGLKNTDALESVTAFYSMILTDTPRPEFSWTFEDNGAIRVKAESKPKVVKLWQATNPDARDFRLETLGKKYTSTVLKPNDKGEYVAEMDKPKKGWTAYFVELTYDTGTPFPYKSTTAVRVIPDVLPHADMDPTAPVALPTSATKASNANSTRRRVREKAGASK